MTPCGTLLSVSVRSSLRCLFFFFRSSDALLPLSVVIVSLLLPIAVTLIPLCVFLPCALHMCFPSTLFFHHRRCCLVTRGCVLAPSTRSRSSCAVILAPLSIFLLTVPLAIYPMLFSFVVFCPFLSMLCLFLESRVQPFPVSHTVSAALGCAPLSCVLRPLPSLWTLINFPPASFFPVRPLPPFLTAAVSLTRSLTPARFSFAFLRGRVASPPPPPPATPSPMGGWERRGRGKGGADGGRRNGNPLPSTHP